MGERLEQLTVRFPASTIVELQERAERDDRTVAQTIRRAIKRYLREPAE